MGIWDLVIVDADKFIRGFSDKSAVSLREIKRFNIFYEFFYDYLNKKKGLASIRI